MYTPLEQLICLWKKFSLEKKAASGGVASHIALLSRYSSCDIHVQYVSIVIGVIGGLITPASACILYS